MPRGIWRLQGRHTFFFKISFFAVKEYFFPNTRSTKTSLTEGATKSGTGCARGSIVRCSNLKHDTQLHHTTRPQCCHHKHDTQLQNSSDPQGCHHNSTLTGSGIIQAVSKVGVPHSGQPPHPDCLGEAFVITTAAQMQRGHRTLNLKMDALSFSLQRSTRLCSYDQTTAYISLFFSPME